MTRPTHFTMQSAAALAGFLAGCSKGPDGAIAASSPDAGRVVPDAALPAALRWTCGKDAEVHVDRKDSPHPVAEAVGSGWCRVPFAAAASTFRIAFRDNLPVQMPAWGPCDDGAPGCRRIAKKSWTTYGRGFDFDVRADHAGKPRLTFYQFFEQPFDLHVPWTRYSWSGELDGPPDFATYLGPPEGGSVDRASSAAGLALDVLPPGESRCGRRFLHAVAPSREAVRSLLGPVTECAGNVSGIDRVNLRGGMLSAASLIMTNAGSGGDTATVVDLQTGTARALRLGNGVFPAAGDPYAAPGGAVLMTGFRGYPLAFVDESTAEATLIVEPPRGRTAVLEGLDWSTTPPTIVWVEGREAAGGLTDVDLYASPFARTPEGITRRKVTHLPIEFWSGCTPNAGYCAIGSDDRDTTWVIRLSDGVRWPFVLHNDHVRSPRWVTRDEIFYLTTNYAAWQASGLTRSVLHDFLDGLERTMLAPLLETTPLPRIP